MELRKQIERLQKWACGKAELDCWKCEYSIYDDCCGSVCPFDNVTQAAEDREEEPENIQPHGIVVIPRTIYEASRDTSIPITADVKVIDESEG